MRWLVVVVALTGVAGADIDRSLIDRTIAAHSHTIRTCYQSALKKDPKLAGKVTVTFTIEPDGKVSDATAVGLTPNVETCVAVVFRKLEFPKGINGPHPAILVYPIVFTSQP